MERADLAFQEGGLPLTTSLSQGMGNRSSRSSSFIRLSLNLPDGAGSVTNLADMKLWPLHL